MQSPHQISQKISEPNKHKNKNLDSLIEVVNAGPDDQFSIQASGREVKEREECDCLKFVKVGLEMIVMQTFKNKKNRRSASVTQKTLEQMM